MFSVGFAIARLGDDDGLLAFGRGASYEMATALLGRLNLICRRAC
jgi:hypothetical protein